MHTQINPTLRYIYKIWGTATDPNNPENVVHIETFIVTVHKSNEQSFHKHMLHAAKYNEKGERRFEIPGVPNPFYFQIKQPEYAIEGIELIGTGRVEEYGEMIDTC